MRSHAILAVKLAVPLLFAIPAALIGGTNPSSTALSSSLTASVYGTPVTLTAVVAPPTVAGKVTFYDGTTVLGTTRLTAGLATLITHLLPSGVRTLKAYYGGDADYGPSTSATLAQTVNVVPGGGFTAVESYATGAHAGDTRGYLAVGDFNGDGKADLAVAEPAGNAVGVLLGNGDGTFQAAASYFVPSGPVGAAAGDFNGDGKADLVTINNTGSVSVLLGNGDGTFQAQVSYFAGGPPFVVVADFNGDGKPDLVTSGGGAQVSVLLGNGDGTFQAAVNYGVGSGPVFCAAGDFNGDGKADLAVVNSIDNYVSVLLGKGDGTFQPAINYGLGNYPSGTVPYPSSIVVADFNGDGKADLIVGNSAGNSVSEMLGNGDGTFAAAVHYSTGGEPITVGVGDFNGDGKPDVAVALSFSNDVGVLLGDGDGTFRPLVTYGLGNYQFGSSNYPPSMVVADFNGDGIADLATSYQGGSGVGILLGRTPAPDLANVVTHSGDFSQGQSGTTHGPVAQPANVQLPRTLVPFQNNVAVGKTATQSSTFGGANASLAVDGNTDGNFGDGSVSTTNMDANSWWQVDLGAPAAVNSIAIWNRTDCCGSRLSDYWVFVSNTPFLASDTPATLSGRAGTFSSHQTSAPAPSADIAIGVQGQYVRLQLSDPGYLSLAEVQVFAATGDLALGEAATQSSTYGSSSASLAVDGNPDGNFYDNSVSTTGLDANAWWQVDLGASAAVSSMAIWNRTDCCGSRLSDYWVFVSDTPFLASDTPATLAGRAGTFGSHQTSAPGPNANIAIGAVGRYVRVQLSAPGYLSLAEVQVFGTIADVALGQLATQSSPGGGAASLAVDGNTDGNFYDGSVSIASNGPAGLWWQVDLGASATLNSIVIWNRTDCCESELSNYYVFVSDTPISPPDLYVGTFYSYQAVTPSPSSRIVIPGAQGRYVWIAPIGGNYLSLAEVQVFGTLVSPTTPANVAPGNAATQSSTWGGMYGAKASLAIDGNTDGNFSDSSVSSTGLDTNAWWQVDLGAPVSVSSIAVWNRTDCCASQLDDYWVFVSDTPFQSTDTPATLSGRAGTFSSHQTTAPSPNASVVIPGAQGRFVRVQLDGTGYLSLAEVQVLGTFVPNAPTDVALGQVATQSSNYPTNNESAFASRAVDGNNDGNFYDNSVSSTLLDTNAWWEVDLGAPVSVSALVIWNRTDCCESRLDDYWVFVSDTPFLSSDTPATLSGRAGTFSSHQTTAPSPAASVAIGVQGRYVRVQLSNPGYLSLAEVQVFSP